MIRATFLDGQFLLAMPTMTDGRFDHSVIYICSHSEDGAMGLVINSRAANIDFPELLDHLDVTRDPECLSDGYIGKDRTGEKIIVHAGGPVEIGRGFILHTTDYVQKSTMIISETVALTATIDILAAIVRGDGPQDFIVALGYTGWGRGQLEDEIGRNSWLNIEADAELLFRTDLELKWSRGMTKLGVDINMLSIYSGNA